MDSQIVGQTLKFTGILDEACKQDELVSLLEEARGNGNDEVEVDFSSTKYANSAGILVWIKVLEAYGYPIKYIQAPKWLVNQFNMVPQLINGKNSVQNIEIPFYNSETDKEICLFYAIGREIPIQENYDGFVVKSVNEDGLEFLPDIIPEKYFSFISKNEELFNAD